MTATRIYLVAQTDPSIDASDRLIRASGPAQAIRHAAKSTFTAKVASQDDLVDLTGAGVKVQDAGAEEGDPK